MQVSKVLVVDGDGVARDTLVTCLNFVGVEAHGAENAAAARSWLTQEFADVLVLSDDVVDAGAAALVSDSIAGAHRKASVILLTRDGSLPSSLADHLVDDSLRRPIAISRVVERVESLIRERSMNGGIRLRFNALSLDVANARLACDQRAIQIGQTETRILAFFIGNPDKVFSRAQLLRHLWPASVRVEERTVDVHIRRLRLGLETVGCAHYVQTVRGSGYRFSSFA